MKFYKLDSSVISLKNNPSQFLNGLTSNETDAPQNAFLTIHGRIITTFYQKSINDNETWIIVPNDHIDPLLKHLDRYIKLSGIEAQRLNHSVYFNIEKEDTAPESSVVIGLPNGSIVLTESPIETEATEEDFILYRLKNNIPLQGIDYTDEFILNVGSEGLVSFDKGCFLGQEPVSKVHNRSRPSWQLVVAYEDECSEEEKGKMTSKALDPATNRVLGFVFKRNEQSQEDTQS